MNIVSLCSNLVVSIDEGATLRQAANLMREQHVGSLVVTATAAGETHAHAVGVLTDRDLAIEGVARDLPVDSTTVGRIASRKIAAVSATGDILDAASVMRTSGVRRLLVVGAEGQLEGVLSTDDLVGALTAELGALAEALASGLEREGRERPKVGDPPRPVFLARGTPGWPLPSPPIAGSRG